MVHDVFVNASAASGFYCGIFFFCAMACLAAGVDYLLGLVYKYRAKWRDYKRAQKDGEK